MKDAQATAVLNDMLNLALAVRDEGPAGIAEAAQAVLAAADGDCVAALCIAAALVRVDEPVDPWWQRGLDGLRGALSAGELAAAAILPSTIPPQALAPCGTHSAYRRHMRRREPLDDPCRLAGRRWETERRRERTRRQAAAGAGDRRSA